MYPGQIVDLVRVALFVVAMLTAHELAHIAVARSHGYRVICLGLSPLAVGIVFLDEPVRRYWVLQLLAPLFVTAAVIYVGIFVVPAAEVMTLFSQADLRWGLTFSLVLSALTSSGDLVSMVMEMRRPIWGKARVVRDVRMLRRMGSLVRFTAFGREYLAEEFKLSPGEFVRAVGAMQPTQT